MGTEKSSIRLTPELVPQPLWRRSVYQSMQRNVWNREIRTRVMEEAKQVCAYCGVSYEKGMVCHEEWEYDDDRHIARLLGFNLVCRDCSNAIHFGKSSKLGLQKQVLEHLVKVNGIKMDEVKIIVSEALDIWATRSGIEDWQIEIDKDLLTTYPVIANVKIE
jgi:hypothetical protein